MTTGEKIRAARLARFISQEALAKRLCMTRSRLDRWETGVSKPDINDLNWLAHEFHVRPSHFDMDEDLPSQD